MPTTCDIGAAVSKPNESNPKPNLSESIVARGVRTNNLKGIDVTVPHNCLTVIAGPSGSGKSSLAIETIYAEAQRQYIESLAFSSRHWIQPLPPPEADEIRGLPAAISIDQHKGSSNSRSTVGTLTEIHDYLRVLMARAGQPVCPKCQLPIEQSSITDVVRQLCSLPERTKVMVLAPCRVDEKHSVRDVVNGIRKTGQVRIHVNGQVFDIDEFDDFTANLTVIDAVIDRVIIKETVADRLSESFGVAEKLSNEFDTKGSLAVSYLLAGAAQDEWQIKRFSTQYKCPKCDLSLGQIEPRNFSFNSPYGGCSKCDGLGSVERFDPALFVFDWTLSIRTGAVRPWEKLPEDEMEQRIVQLQPTLEKLGITSVDTLERLDLSQRQKLLGDSPDSAGTIIALVTKEWATCTDKRRLAELNQFRNPQPCEQCKGSRLNEVSRFVLFGGHSLPEVNHFDLKSCLDFFQSVEIPKRLKPIATPLLDEITHRLEYLNSIGLGYLSLDRGADSLSGGEYQRVRLATAAGTALTGVCYVLDEPSIGLHPADSMKLIEAMKKLRDQQNTVVVVEHDHLVKQNADWVIEIGPRAGPEGGQLVYQGPVRPEVIEKEKRRPGQVNSVRNVDWDQSVNLFGARGHNLKDVDVHIPLDCLVCFTGVSGSGKSTLVNLTLVPALKRKLGLMSARPLPNKSLDDHGKILQVVAIDQAPIGRSPRSNAATYTGILDQIRNLFAATKSAKQFGFNASRFSFNSKAGACPACQGYGAHKISMAMMPDTWVKCDLCDGKRFNEQTLQVQFAGKTIADVLAMNVSEAETFFQNVEKVHRILACLKQIGLGYLGLGQPANTLSGGEAQRINLAVALAKSTNQHTLFVLDEPTTGLHSENVHQLLSVLNDLVDAGNSVLVIEHNTDLISAADWIVDMGPGGGPNGGEVVFCGRPLEAVQKSETSIGKYLNQHR